MPGAMTRHLLSSPWDTHLLCCGCTGFPLHASLIQHGSAERGPAQGMLCSQLEVLRNSEDGAERGSLLWLLDHTKTAMGGRLLRHWVAHPLRHAPFIQARLDAVQELAQAAAGGEACTC